MRDNAWKWIGPTEDREEYAEVDRRREMNGIIRGSAEKAIEEWDDDEDDGEGEGELV